MTRPLRSWATGAAAAVLVLGAACGGGSDEVRTAGPTTTTEAAPPGTAPETTTTEAPRPRLEYPAGGPLDPVFPPGDEAYDMLADGRCDELLTAAEGWEGQGVAEQEGVHTIPLYLSAAHACLGNWDQAEAAFDQMTDPLDFGFGDPCPREAVYDWVSTLVSARRADPGFDPVFEESSGETPCPDDTTTEPTEAGGG